MEPYPQSVTIIMCLGIGLVLRDLEFSQFQTGEENRHGIILDSSNQHLAHSILEWGHHQALLHVCNDLLEDIQICFHDEEDHHPNKLLSPPLVSPIQSGPTMLEIAPKDDNLHVSVRKDIAMPDEQQDHPKVVSPSKDEEDDEEQPVRKGKRHQKQVDKDTQDQAPLAKRQRIYQPKLPHSQPLQTRSAALSVINNVMFYLFPTKFFIK
jgi:hypothetical protein